MSTEQRVTQLEQKVESLARTLNDLCELHKLMAGRTYALADAQRTFTDKNRANLDNQKKNGV